MLTNSTYVFVKYVKWKLEQKVHPRQVHLITWFKSYEVHVAGWLTEILNWYPSPSF
jgi:hypothetical protein